MSTPQRILDSRQFRLFMEWFELFAVAFFMLIITVIIFVAFYGLFWWLS